VDGVAPGVALDEAAPPALEEDESLDGAADDGPVELAGGVAGVDADGEAGGVAGAVDCAGGVALLSVLPSSLPQADSARATAAANSSEVLFMFNASLKGC
jgi:hypothetical protein